MIRDRIVVGIRNAPLSEKLQLDSALTLEKAVIQVRQSEAIKQQQPLLRGGSAKQDTPIGQFKRQREVDSHIRAGADRTVGPPPRNSLATAHHAPDVAKSLPMIVSIALLRKLHAGNVIRRDTSRQCAGLQ